MLGTIGYKNIFLIVTWWHSMNMQICTRVCVCLCVYPNPVLNLSNSRKGKEYVFNKYLLKNNDL